MNGDQWWQYEVEPVTGRNRLSNIWVWNGTEFVEFQIVADSLLIPGSVGNILLADGAIDAMTITGATMRTATTGQRMQFDVNGLRTFNSSNVETSLLESASGMMRLKGAMLLGEQGNLGLPPQISGDAYRPGSEFTHPTLGASHAVGQYSGASASLSSHALASNQMGFFAASVSPTESRIEMDARDEDDPYPHFGAKIVRSIDKTLKIENAEGPLILTTSRSSPLTESSIVIGTAAENSVEVRASEVVFNGGFGESAGVTINGTLAFGSDLPWTMADASGSPADRAGLRNSWTNNINANWNGLQTRRKADVVYITGAIWKTTAYATLEVVAVLPLALRPAVPTMVPAAYGTSGGYVLVRANGEIVTAQSGASGQIAMAGTLVPA